MRLVCVHHDVIVARAWGPCPLYAALRSTYLTTSHFLSITLTNFNKYFICHLYFLTHNG